MAKRCASKFWVEYFYDINEYTITYNANGSSGAPESQTKYHGFDLTLSETVPTRSGYTFKGWETSSTDTSVNYEPGGTMKPKGKNFFREYRNLLKNA